MGINRDIQRAVFLDRDGVITRPVVRAGKPYPPASAADAEVLPGVAEALVRLKAAGFRLIVVTNQPDVARGTIRREVVETIHADLAARLPEIDAFYTCFHDDGDRCHCRKPEPGLLLTGAEDWGLDLAGSFMVGDRWRDIDAGQRAGCRTVFLTWGYDERRPDNPDATVRSLAEAAEWILQEAERRS